MRTEPAFFFWDLFQRHLSSVKLLSKLQSLNPPPPPPQALGTPAAHHFVFTNPAGTHGDRSSLPLCCASSRGIRGALRAETGHLPLLPLSLANVLYPILAPLLFLVYIKMSHKWKLSSGNFFQFMRANQGHVRPRTALDATRRRRSRIDRCQGNNAIPIY